MVMKASEYEKIAMKSLSDFRNLKLRSVAKIGIENEKIRILKKRFSILFGFSPNIEKPFRIK